MLGTVSYVKPSTYLAAGYGLLDNQYTFYDQGFAVGDLVQFELRQAKFAPVAFGLQKTLTIPSYPPTRPLPTYVLPNDPVLNIPRVKAAVLAGHW